jgi:hypothetical protein
MSLIAVTNEQLEIGAKAHHKHTYESYLKHVYRITSVNMKNLRIFDVIFNTFHAHLNITFIRGNCAHKFIIDSPIIVLKLMLFS